MLTVSPKHRIYLSIQPLDFRKGLDSIARLCQRQLNLDPQSGHYFIFRNRRKSSLKLLYYDSQGFCLFQKRLSTGRFQHWPTAATSVVTLTPSQLHVLLFNGCPLSTQEGGPWRSIE